VRILTLEAALFHQALVRAHRRGNGAKRRATASSGATAGGFPELRQQGLVGGLLLGQVARDYATRSLCIAVDEISKGGSGLPEMERSSDRS
jgi:hypothetical protein